MTNVLKLAPLDLARRQGQAWVLALQRLHARQFIRTDDPLALLGQARRRAVDGTHGGDFGVEVGIVGWRQPVTDAVRLELPLFRRRAACRSEIRSTLPRRMISAAISRPVQ